MQQTLLNVLSDWESRAAAEHAAQVHLRDEKN
jgi:GDP-4-dehydro-6-deoxy-D-mannose reductase